MHKDNSLEIYKVFCSKKNDAEDFPDTDYSPIYWVPLASIFLFIVFFIIDGFIPRIYEWKCSKTKTSKRQTEKDARNGDQKYNMNLLHNPEMTIEQKQDSQGLASPQPASSQQQSSSGVVQ